MTEETETKKRGPSHIAYHVRDGEGEKSYFNRIGSAWPHKDGKGFNVQLDSLPVDGRITIRSAKDRVKEMKDAFQESGSQGLPALQPGPSKSRSRDDGPGMER
ncbi:hypothetical protein A7A08_02346 [Methyloligella halotolerans]|uniref:Uncharacterized protein n=1 Tax=Methyloligella halotolerans TaxID=1177755 RepID=A0A1E2RWZ1_9HYPH|nr:hypothetical protein A7A08_02346 [Methyloligella halotolerans]